LTRLSFGPFTLDLEMRLLLREADREPVHLSPKAYDLLCVLIETRPRAVGKSELHGRLWPSTFVSEATLTSVVAELREALGDRGRHARFIRTVHAFGYAFSGQVNEAGAVAARIEHWVVCNGREIGLCEGDHVIGRDADVTVAVATSTASRRHALIRIRGPEATLDDLGSKNGTFVDERPVNAPTPLVDGSRILVGTCELTFRSLVGRASTETAG
jgi:DNA-binding winged helix-turn-helix (wHTH) protein